MTNFDLIGYSYILYLLNSKYYAKYKQLPLEVRTLKHNIILNIVTVEY